MKRGNDTSERRAIVADYLGQSDASRTYAMVSMRLDGKTLRQIGGEFGLSNERVRGILARFRNQLRRALSSLK